MSEEDNPSVTELIAKIDEQNKRILELETQNKNFENEISKFNESITNKDNEITKLQKILANNFVASSEKPKDDLKTVPFEDAYKQMIENNRKK